MSTNKRLKPISVHIKEQDDELATKEEINDIEKIHNIAKERIQLDYPSKIERGFSKEGGATHY